MKEREKEAIEFFKSESESDGEEQAEKKPEPPIEEIITEQPIIECQEEEQVVDLPEKEIEPTPPCLKTLGQLNAKDAIIDLSTGQIQAKKLTGAEMLFQRYLKSVNKPKHKDSVSMNILSVENGKLENQRVEVKLDKEVELDHNRPGLSHEQLKEGLRNKIMQMRLEVAKKKQAKIKKEQEDEEIEEKAKELSDDEDEDENQPDDVEPAKRNQFECDEVNFATIFRDFFNN